MGASTDLYDEIRRIIFLETRYLRTYYGTVQSNFDLLGVGQLQGVIYVSVTELDADTPDRWLRCYPRQLHGISVPAVGETVEIYFRDRSPNQAVYMGQAQEIALNNPVNYSGLPTQNIVFESPILKQYIEVDDTTGKISINPTLFGEFGGSTEPLVLGNQLLAFLSALVGEINAFITVYNTHAHPHRS
jgi:hypothetical protein